MLPTYEPGARVVVIRTSASRVRVGDVVVVADPTFRPTGGARSVRGLASHSWLLKRVAGVPGDLVPSWLSTAPALSSADRVPQGALLLLGDAGDASRDSKQLGFFAFDQVLGVAVGRWRREGHGLS